MLQGGICLDGKLKLLVVGTIPTKSKKNFEAIVTGRQYQSLQNDDNSNTDHNNNFEAIVSGT